MWYTAATPAPGTWKQEIKHLKARHYKPCQKPMTRRESTGHGWNTLSCQTSSCQSAFYIFMLIPIGVRCSQLWSEKLLSAVGNDYCMQRLLSSPVSGRPDHKCSAGMISINLPIQGFEKDRGKKVRAGG